MPNHVTHRITIKGSKEAIDGFWNAFVDTKDGNTFDFNRLVPMPEIVRKTESSSVASVGLIILGRNDEDAEIYLTYPRVKAEGVKTIDDLKTFLAKRYPNAVNAAEATIRCIDETGYKSWYEWSCAKWGTKCNSYSFSWEAIDDTTAVMMFDTAWSPPEPVFMALADRPEVEGLEIGIVAFDEGWRFAYRAKIVEGEYNELPAEADDATYEEVYGEAPEYDEEDA